MDLRLRRRHLLTWMLLGPLLVLATTGGILLFANQPMHQAETAPLSSAEASP